MGDNPLVYIPVLAGVLGFIALFIAQSNRKSNEEDKNKKLNKKDLSLKIFYDNLNKIVTLDKRYQLRKVLPIRDDKNLHGSGYFTLSGGFLSSPSGHGSVSFNTSTASSVRLSWRNNEGFYIISDIPLSKIRISIDNSLEVPEISFSNRVLADTFAHQYAWSRRDVEYWVLGEYLFEGKYVLSPTTKENDIVNLLDTVTLYCKEEDWTFDTTMPLGKKTIG